MEELKLIEPTIKYSKQVLKYKLDMIKAKSAMDGCEELEKRDVQTWLKFCETSKNEGTKVFGSNIHTTQFLCVRDSDKKLVGMLNIKHELNPTLYNFIGNICNSVAVDERNKGYGKQLLRLGLEECKKMGMNEVLVTCRQENYVSRKCILANGGKFEDMRHIDDNFYERYWVDLNSKNFKEKSKEKQS